MRYRVYFSEAETKQIQEAARQAGMSDPRYIRRLVSKHLSPQPSTHEEPENDTHSAYVSRRFRLTQGESDKLNQSAKNRDMTPTMYLRRLIRQSGTMEIYISIEDLSALMAVYTEMTEAVMRQTRLLLRSNALPQDGELLQEQMKTLEKQVLSIFDDVVRYRKQAVEKIMEELKDADS